MNWWRVWPADHEARMGEDYLAPTPEIAADHYGQDAWEEGEFGYNETIDVKVALQDGIRPGCTEGYRYTLSATSMVQITVDPWLVRS